MLLPVKDQGPLRTTRRRSYSHGSIYSHKGVRSSKLSLMSAFTVQSSGSNGSNSTVTMESFNRAGKKKRAGKRRRTDAVRSLSPAMDVVEEVSAERDTERHIDDDVDVFAYLVEDDHGLPTGQEPMQTTQAEPQQDARSCPDYSLTEGDYSTHSFNSDSGISLDDGNPTCGKTVLHPLLPVVPEDHHQQSASHPELSHWYYPKVPRPQHQPVAPFDPVFAETQDEHVGREQPRRTPAQPAPVVMEDTTIPLSTDHLAAEYAAMDTPPLFKAFKKSNYRILLQLQDEITDLEEQLNRLDTYDGSHRLSKDASTGEKLRRLSWQWDQRPFDLYQAKSEVLGRLQVRLDQYYKAIELTRTMSRLQQASPCTADQATSFKARLKAHCTSVSNASDDRPVTKIPDCAFLDSPDDLIAAASPLRARVAAPSCVLIPEIMGGLLVLSLIFHYTSGRDNKLAIGLTMLSAAMYCFVPDGEVRWKVAMPGVDHTSASRMLLAVIVVWVAVEALLVG